MIPLVFHPIYSQLELPFRHRFPIEKYVGIRNALTSMEFPIIPLKNQHQLMLII